MSAASKAYQQVVKHEGSTRREHSAIWCLCKTTAGDKNSRQNSRKNYEGCKTSEKQTLLVNAVPVPK